jgi:two-component system, OmpR family, response regulator
MSYRIWIVEDDDKIADILKDYIEKYGYLVSRADVRADLKAQFLAEEPSLVLLDINLPHYDGFYWCRQFRTVSNVPILFISARVGDMDQVMAIENGGDDYITKPFHLDLVMAKIKGALRRVYGEYAGLPGGARQEVSELRGLYWDRSRNTLEWSGRKTDLTKNEFLLFDCLARRQGQVVSREELLEYLWDDVEFVDDNTLTVNIARVRKKLEELGIPKAIDTVRGQGYRLSPAWGGEYA